MLRKIVVSILVFSFTLLLLGCDFNLQSTTSVLSNTSTQSAYEIWKNSDEAEDLNGDRKINEDDYTLFITPPLSAYEVWKNSENAQDLNDDSVIDELDYAIYLDPPLTAYEKWKNSDEAVDLDGDRKINESDYTIYLIMNDYTYWKNSQEALDMNNDRKIDESDFESYKLHNFFDYWNSSEISDDFNDDGKVDSIDFEIYVNYDNWKLSKEAEDLNSDSLINIEDFEIYIEFIEFVGSYHIANYTFSSTKTYIISGANIRLGDFGLYLSQILIEIDNKGTMIVTVPDTVKSALDIFYDVLIEGVNNMTISRISPFIVVFDTSVTIETVEVNFTLYLNETEGGYSATYIIGIFDEKPTMTFDIIKAE